MLAFFPGEVQVLTPSPGILRVLYPMDAIAAVGLTLGTAFILFMSRVAYRWNGKFPWLTVLLAPVMLYFSLDAIFYRGTLTLSPPANTVTIQERSFYYRHTTTYPLADFSSAYAESGSSWNKQLVLVRPSGQSVSFGNGFTGRLGIDHAAFAINGFLSHNEHR